MSSVYTSTPPTTFDNLYTRLRTFPTPLLPPSKPHDAALTDTIASLYLHPALEALLHILNHDLPSAHFLCRKMQAAPAHEGMHVHGVLHRVEGDYDNARAWYADVQDSECFVSVWGPATAEERAEADEVKGRYRTGKVPAQRTARTFLDAVEKLGKQRRGDRHALEQESRRELERLVQWCAAEFGTSKWEDASEAWVGNSEEIRKIGQSMTTGNTGHRVF